MNKHSMIALAALVASFAVQAAEPVTVPTTAATSPPAASVAAPVKLAPSAAVAAPQKTAATSSQQDRMRNCNKQATGKKGPERKAFMKTCLSNKA